MHIECVRVLNVVNVIAARVSAWASTRICLDVHGTMVMIHIAFAHKHTSIQRSVRYTVITRVKGTRCHTVRHDVCVRQKYNVCCRHFGNLHHLNAAQIYVREIEQA